MTITFAWFHGITIVCRWLGGFHATTTTNKQVLVLQLHAWISFVDPTRPIASSVQHRLLDGL
jgi:hypothetical protein